MSTALYVTEGIFAVLYVSLLWALHVFIKRQFFYIYITLLLQAVNCGRFVFWCRQSMVFCLCTKYLGNRWMDLRQIQTEDVFGSSLRRVWRSSSKVKVSRDTKYSIFWPCMRFMFGKTSLASSFILTSWFLLHLDMKYICCMYRLPMAILRTLLQELLKLVSADDMSVIPDFSELKPEARFAVLLYHRWQVQFHMLCNVCPECT